ncbi:uncharacterized protein EI90DRAFT_2940401, partial [Cantharellus anzutake]|uniref:uncharacterized protein n=1 Tax=Cantharellus anzutake TaxID=1750568 RepID=UPI0019034B53
PVKDSLDLHQVYGDTALGNDESEVLNAALLKLALFQFEEELPLPQRFQHLPHNLLVFLRSGCKNQDVIHVTNNNFPVDEVLEDIIHHGLESCRGVAQPEEHYCGFKQAPVSRKHCKRGEWLKRLQGHKTSEPEQTTLTHHTGNERGRSETAALTDSVRAYTLTYHTRIHTRTRTCTRTCTRLLHSPRAPCAGRSVQPDGPDLGSRVSCDFRISPEVFNVLWPLWEDEKLTSFSSLTHSRLCPG